MSIKLTSYKINSHTDDTPPHTVYVRAHFTADGLAEAEALIVGLRSLTGKKLDESVGQDKPAMPENVRALADAPKKAKAAPKPPKTDTSTAGSTPEADRVRLQQVQAANGVHVPMKPAVIDAQGDVHEDDAGDAPPESDPDLPEDEEESKAGSSEPETPAVPEGPRPKAKITPAMIEAGRFTDVVVGLHKQGFVEAEIVTICTKVHDKIEAVKKVKVEDLAKRVKRVYEIEGLG